MARDNFLGHCTVLELDGNTYYYLQRHRSRFPYIPRLCFLTLRFYYSHSFCPFCSPLFPQLHHFPVAHSPLAGEKDEDTFPKLSNLVLQLYPSESNAHRVGVLSV
jgi:hypothetical protein